MTKCDFFIIGAAKAGTTSLHKRLSAHPELYFATPKEPEFFARDEKYGQGIESYSRLFSGALPSQLKGEASTLYSLSSLFPETALRIKLYNPDAKFIYMLREPVARSFSYYCQLVKNYQNGTRDYRVNRSFEDFLFRESGESYSRENFFAPFDSHLPDVPLLLTDGSEYTRQIRAYLEHFSVDNFLFVTFESFVRDQDACCEQVLQFLGVDPSLMPAQIETSVNRSADYDDRTADALAVQTLSNKLGGFSVLKSFLPRGARGYLRRIYLHLNTDERPDQHIPRRPLPETLAYLKKQFYAEIDELKGITGLAFDEWQA